MWVTTVDDRCRFFFRLFRRFRIFRFFRKRLLGQMLRKIILGEMRKLQEPDVCVLQLCLGALCYAVIMYVHLYIRSIKHVRLSFTNYATTMYRWLYTRLQLYVVMIQLCLGALWFRIEVLTVFDILSVPLI